MLGTPFPSRHELPLSHSRCRLHYVLFRVIRPLLIASTNTGGGACHLTPTPESRLCRLLRSSTREFKMWGENPRIVLEPVHFCMFLRPYYSIRHGLTTVFWKQWTPVSYDRYSHSAATLEYLKPAECGGRGNDCDKYIHNIGPNTDPCLLLMPYSSPITVRQYLTLQIICVLHLTQMTLWLRFRHVLVAVD